MPSPRNQRNNKLYSSISHNSRSERTEYSAISSMLLSSVSGGTDCRPPSAYMALNTRLMRRSASSA